jgi:AraC-like DNA-binding protein
MQHIIHENALIKVEDLASMLNVSRRTLLRKFKKHLGYSIEKYRKVIKFRMALSHFENNKNNLHLSDAALSSNYYDQADLYHNLKSKSGLTPKQLLEQLEIIDHTLLWKV